MRQSQLRAGLAQEYPSRSTFRNRTMVLQQMGFDDSPEFDQMYGFLSREDKQRLKKSYGNEREFIKVMRSLRDSTATSKAPNKQLMHFPSSLRNLHRFMELLKSRSEASMLLKSKQPIEEKVESIGKLFQLTRDFGSDGRVERKRASSISKQDEDRRKAIMVLGHDEGNNPDAAFKRLTKMSIGLEQCKQLFHSDTEKLTKAASPETKQTQNDRSLTGKTKATPQKNLPTSQPRPYTTSSLLKRASSTKHSCRRLKGWQQKLLQSTTQPLINFKELRPKNYNRMHREISCLVGRANKLYGLKLKCPKELDFTDEQLRNQIINIHPRFIDESVKTTVHKTRSKENDGLVPVTLLKTLQRPKTTVRTRGNRHAIAGRTTTTDFQFKTLHF